MFAQKDMAKIKKRFLRALPISMILFLVVALVSFMCFPALFSRAAVVGDYTNNGAPAITMGPSAIDVLALDIVIPDGTNTGGVSATTADTLLLDNSAVAWNGDVLSPMAPNEYFLDDNYDTVWANGTEAVWVDTNVNLSIEAGEIQADGTADLENFSPAGANAEYVFDDTVTDQGPGMASAEYDSTEAIWQDVDGNSLLGPADSLLKGGTSAFINIDTPAAIATCAGAAATAPGAGPGFCHGEPNADDFYLCDGPGGAVNGIYDPGESLFIDLLASPTPGDYDVGVDVMLTDPSTLVTPVGCALAGGTVISLTSGVGAPHPIMFLDADKSGTYGVAGGTGYVPGASQGEVLIIYNLAPVLADNGSMTIPNFGGIEPAHPDIAIASPAYDATVLDWSLMSVAKSANNYKFIGFSSAADTFTGTEAIIDESLGASAGTLEAGEIINGETFIRAAVGPGTLHQNFTGSESYNGGAPFTSAKNIYDDSVGSNAGTLDKSADELNAITIQNTGTAVATTDISAVKVYADGGNNNYDGGGGDDMLVGTAAWDGVDSWDLSGLTYPVPLNGVQLFVTFDLTATPTHGSTIQMQIPTLNDAEVNGLYDAGNLGVFMVSNNDGPVGGPVVNGAIQTIDSLTTVSDPAISILSAGSGLGGVEEYIIGDTLVVQWDDTIDGNGDIVSATVNFAAFGGGGAVAMEDDGAGGTCNDGGAGDDVWCATYTISGGGIDSNGANNLNVLVSATDFFGNNATNADSTGLDCDSIAPNITSNGTLTITTDNGVAGVAALNDGATNQDKVTQSAVTISNPDGDVTRINLSSLTGQALVAPGVQSGVVIPGALDNPAKTFVIHVRDNAGNVSSFASDAISVDNVVPTPTDINISADTGTGVGGAFIVGDTVNVTWDAASDGITDAASAVADVTAFGGGFVGFVEGAGCGGVPGDNVWDACFGTGLVDGTNINVTVTVTDDAGNISAAIPDTSNSTVDTIVPNVTAGNVTVTGCSGTGGACIIGDTPILNWLGDTDGETDTIASVTFDGSDFRAGDIALAAGDPGTPGTNNWNVGLSGALDAQETAGNTIDVTVVDNAGNSTGPITSAVSYTVDTIAPTIVTTSPADSATGVGISDDVVVTFSEVMKTSTVGLTSNPDPGGWSYLWSGGNTVITFSHSTTFNNNTSYQQTIFGASTDMSGNALVAGAVPNPWNFTTVPRSSSAGSISPTNNEVLINSGDDTTDDLNVTLSLSSTNASMMLVDNDPNFPDAEWEVYSKTKSWTLTEGEGEKTVYVKFKSSSQNQSATVSDTIEYAVSDESVEEPAEEGTEEEEGTDEEPITKVSGLDFGDLLKTSANSTVYYYGSDGLRHAFPNEMIYFSWFADFSGVKIITSTLMGEIDLGDNVTVRPGTWLIKIQTDPKVYAVEPGGVIRWIINEDIASTLYGADWSTRVRDINVAFFPDYVKGENVGSNEHPTGSLVKYVDEPYVYYIEDSLRRLIANENVFYANGLQFDHVLDTAISYSNGATVSGQESAISMPY